MAKDHEQYEQYIREYFSQFGQFENVEDPLGGTDKYPVYRNGDLAIVRSSSGLVFRDPQPTEECLNAFYAKSRAMSKWSEMKHDDELRQKIKFSSVIDFIHSRKIKSVLDYGCGNGFFINRVLEYNPYCQVAGVEPNKAAQEYCRRVYKIDLTDEIPEGKRYEMTSAWGVFEHVKDPIGLARTLSEHTTPGGYVVSCVPNVESTVVEQLGGRCFTFCPQHLWYFSKKTIARVMEEAGLEVVSQETIELETVPVAKSRLGFEPYKPLPPGAISDDDFVSYMQEITTETLQRDKGYKIVTIARKNG